MTNGYDPRDHLMVDESYVPTIHDTPRGRYAPPKPSNVMSISIGGVTIGSIDVEGLTAGAVLDIEDLTKVGDIIKWLVQYAGADKANVLAVLRPLPAHEIKTMFAAIRDAVVKSLEIPSEKKGA